MQCVSRFVRLMSFSNKVLGNFFNNFINSIDLVIFMISNVVLSKTQQINKIGRYL